MKPWAKRTIIVAAFGLSLLLFWRCDRVARPENRQAWEHVHWILDYVRFDYYEALEEHEPEEIQEQLHLMDTAIALARELDAESALVKQLVTIRTSIAEGGDPVLLYQACNRVLAQLVQTKRVVRAPPKAPDIARGRSHYMVACVPCHGAPGNENPPTRALLVPRPPSFHSLDQRETLTPFRVVSALRFGIPGTGMAKPPQFTEEDRWNIGFYVASMRAAHCQHAAPVVSLEELASSTDNELGLRHGEDNLDCLRLAPNGSR